MPVYWVNVISIICDDYNQMKLIIDRSKQYCTLLCTGLSVHSVSFCTEALKDTKLHFWCRLGMVIAQRQNAIEKCLAVWSGGKQYKMEAH